MTLTDTATKVKGRIAGTKCAILLEGDGMGSTGEANGYSRARVHLEGLGASHRYGDDIYHSVG